MDLTPAGLRQISMYTINKESSEQLFDAPLDTSNATDGTLSGFTVKVANANYTVKDLRELIFIETSSVKTWINDILQNRANNDTFKERTKDIAGKLFTITQMNMKKGDLLQGLFEKTEHFIYVILKIDENNYIKRGADGLWLDDVGFNKDFKLQKGLYITIPKIEADYEHNHLNWKILSIDKISGDANYWNKSFLDANFKRDDKTNTIQFRDFFKSYLNTIPDAEEKFRVNYQFLHYAKNNDNFVVDGFVTAVYGDGEESREKREQLTRNIQQASTEHKFDLTFTIAKQLIKKDLKPGSYLLDKRIRIVYTKGLDSQDVADTVLKKQVKIKDDAGIAFTDEDGQTYAKVYYQNIEFNE